MLRVSLFALIATALTLSACGQSGPRTQTIYSSVRGSLAKLQQAALNGGQVSVFVNQAPFDADKNVAQQVAAMLGNEKKALRFRGTGSGIPDVMTGTRVLILHNTPDGYTGISACQGKPYEPAANPKQLEFRAIVCDNAERLVEVLAVLPYAKGDNGAEMDQYAQQYDALLLQASEGLIVEEDRTPR